MPPTAEILTPPKQHRSVDASIALSTLVDRETAQAGLLRSVEPSTDLLIPGFLEGGKETVTVPSLAIETPLGHQARLVALEGSHPGLQKLFNDTRRANKRMPELIEDKTFEALVRILDTNGASGLHHQHGTTFPNTVYFNAKRGNGLLMNVYVTEVGRTKDETGNSVPVFARLTATKDKKSEYDLFKLLGIANRKKKFNH